MITAAPNKVRRLGRADQTARSMTITQASPVYSSGATLAAGAYLKATVMPHWPTAPVTATPASIGKCARAIGTHSDQASAVAPIDSIAVIQNIIDWVLSVRPRIFTITDETA